MKPTQQLGYLTFTQLAFNRCNIIDQVTIMYIQYTCSWEYSCKTYPHFLIYRGLRKGSQESKEVQFRRPFLLGTLLLSTLHMFLVCMGEWKCCWKLMKWCLLQLHSVSGWEEGQKKKEDKKRLKEDSQETLSKQWETPMKARNTRKGKYC